jgi:hypothetical protein
MTSSRPLPSWASFACGGAAACIAEVVTLPIDTCKVRLQLLRKTGAGAGAAQPSTSMLGMFKKVAAEEGVAGLYKGLWPALQRQVVFASLRVGIYKEIGERLKEPGQATLSLGRKVLAGLISGALGITCVPPHACGGAPPLERGAGWHTILLPCPLSHAPSLLAPPPLPPQHDAHTHLAPVLPTPRTL